MHKFNKPLTWNQLQMLHYLWNTRMVDVLIGWNLSAMNNIK